MQKVKSFVAQMNNARDSLDGEEMKDIFSTFDAKLRKLGCKTICSVTDTYYETSYGRGLVRVVVYDDGK